MKNELRISLTTGSLNRLDQLKRALVTWLALREIDEIVIVDWGNLVPLNRSLENFILDSRVKILRTLDQKHWKNAKCHNLEFRFATGDILLRLDNDCLVSPEFFSKHPLCGRMFYSGYWAELLYNNKRNLTGTLLIERQFLYKVNGYNERLIHYGREDDDLYNRLRNFGLKQTNVNIEMLDHIAHSNDERYKNLEIAPRLGNLLEDRLSKMSEEEKASGITERLYLIEKSKNIVKDKPWTSKDRMTDWLITQTSKRCYECVEKPPFSLCSSDQKLSKQ